MAIYIFYFIVPANCRFMATSFHLINVVRHLWTGDLKFYPRTEHFWGTFYFVIKPVLLIFHDSQFSSLFTIVQELTSRSTDHNVILLLHHQVYGTLNDITMTPPWCHNSGTYMSFTSFTKEGHICLPVQ